MKADKPIKFIVNYLSLLFRIEETQIKVEGNITKATPERILFVMTCAKYGLDKADIAEFMGCPVHSVSSLESKGINRCKVCPEFKEKFDRIRWGIKPHSETWERKPDVWNRPKINLVTRLHPDDEWNAKWLIPAHAALAAIDLERERRVYEWHIERDPDSCRSVDWAAKQIRRAHDLHP